MSLGRCPSFAKYSTLNNSSFCLFSRIPYSLKGIFCLLLNAVCHLHTYFLCKHWMKECCLLFPTHLLANMLHKLMHTSLIHTFQLIYFLRIQKIYITYIQTYSFITIYVHLKTYTLSIYTYIPT